MHIRFILLSLITKKFRVIFILQFRVWWMTERDQCIHIKHSKLRKRQCSALYDSMLACWLGNKWISLSGHRFSVALLRKQRAVGSLFIYLSHRLWYFIIVSTYDKITRIQLRLIHNENDCALWGLNFYTLDIYPYCGFHLPPCVLNLLQRLDSQWVSSTILRNDMDLWTV